MAIEPRISTLEELANIVKLFPLVDRHEWNMDTRGYGDDLLGVDRRIELKMARSTYDTSQPDNRRPLEWTDSLYLTLPWGLRTRLTEEGELDRRFIPIALAVAASINTAVSTHSLEPVNKRFREVQPYEVNVSYQIKPVEGITGVISPRVTSKIRLYTPGEYNVKQDAQLEDSNFKFDLDWQEGARELEQIAVVCGMDDYGVLASDNPTKEITSLTKSYILDTYVPALRAHGQFRANS